MSQRERIAAGVGNVTIRLATVVDAEDIRNIYNHEVLTATSTFDLVTRSLAQQEEWITARSGAFSAIVAVDRSPDRRPRHRLRSASSNA